MRGPFGSPQPSFCDILYLMTRRTLVTLPLAPLALQAARKPIGAQLYTLREQLPKSPKEILQQLAAIGYKEVEGVWAGFDQLAPLIKEAGLKIVSLHIDMRLAFGKAGDGAWEKTAETLTSHGIRYGVIPYVMPNERGGLDVYRRMAAEMNKGGELFRKAGLTLCYHNHAFEFEPMEGSSPLKVLLEGWDRKLVSLEADMFWVAIGGADPAAFFKQHKGRIALMHIKDRAAGTPQMYKETVPRTAFKEVGGGDLNVPAILKAASGAGVKHFFVEQDQCPGNPLDSLRQSYQYLEKLSW
ncbi:MAG: sugar phosphate isomerase/epimerase [Acidobacteria bacterium]|nr:sugar phosphate isomerase/epimerase [Acidobacteriota bacterium]